MQKIDFNNKTFTLLSNSKEGKVNNETIFRYKQKGDLVTADYSGGTVIYGKIIALLKGDKLEMLYQCLTTDNELKAGKAIADVSFTALSKIQLDLNWEWLDNEGSGQSTYLETKL